MTPALLPERHPKKDFFIADIFDSIPVKNDRHTMEHPFFTLSTKPDIRTIHYQRNGVEIKLNPHNELGLPTMFDKDILLYCGSLIMAEINKGHIPPKKLRFSCHDLMMTTNRESNGKGYKLLKKAFERLKGVSITTDIKTNDLKQASGFGIIDSWDIIEKSHQNSRMVRIEVTLSNWFYNALIGKEVLTINRDYFRLRKPLERRLYELARKHCGTQAKWSINLKNLHEKSGSLSPLKHFRGYIKSIILADLEQDHFPDYGLSLNDKDLVTFYYKHHITAPIGDKIGHLNLRDSTLEQAYMIVAKARTGWDLHVLVNEYVHYIQKKGAPEKLDAAFLGFIRKKVTYAP